MIQITIDGVQQDDRTKVVRHLTAIPELNEGRKSYGTYRVLVRVLRERTTTPTVNTIEVYPRRYQFGEWQDPQIATSGCTRMMQDAEEHLAAYREAYALASEARTLAAVYLEQIRDQEAELAAKAKAAHELFSAPPRIEPQSAEEA